MTGLIARDLAYLAAALGDPLPALAVEAETARQRREAAATDLLDLMVDAHGGMHRWQQFSRFRARISLSGAIFDWMRKPGALRDVDLDGQIRSQRVRISPFPGSGTSSTWAPPRHTIESVDGAIIAETDDRSAGSHETNASLWNDIQVAHFASAASWSYLVSPFVFTGSQFVREEIEAWREDGQIWRRLVVTRPETVVANTRQQTVFVDADGLVRRIDYAVDTLGGAAVVQYASRYREFDGIKVPTRRRVYLRKPDGSLARQAPTFGFDIRELHYLGDAPEDSHHIIRGGPDDPH